MASSVNVALLVEPFDREDYGPLCIIFISSVLAFFHRYVLWQSYNFREPRSGSLFQVFPFVAFFSWLVVTTFRTFG
jgi:hypothetical protein